MEYGWIKLRKMSGVLYNKKIPNRPKGKFYKARSAMMYRSKIWTINTNIKQNMSVAES